MTNSAVKLTIKICNFAALVGQLVTHVNREYG